MPTTEPTTTGHIGPTAIIVIPTPLPPDFQARYDAANHASEELVRSMGAEIAALRAEVVRLRAAALPLP